VVIQTYKPENYAIKHASDQDYEGFYEEEMLFREMADYPPVSHMLSLQLFGDDEEHLMRYAHELSDYIKTVKSDNIFIIGPSKAVLSKIKDVHRAVIHLKSESDDELIAVKDMAEEYFKNTRDNIKDKMMLQFDLDPVSSF
jgi:primosomal protein N' (replication factor Y)